VLEEDADEELGKESTAGRRWQGTGDGGGARGHDAAPAAARRGTARGVGEARDAGEDPKEHVVGQSGCRWRRAATHIVVGFSAHVSSDEAGAAAATVRQPAVVVRTSGGICLASSTHGRHHAGRRRDGRINE